jgi:uncharacterized membrane protein (DUF485 family)
MSDATVARIEANPKYQELKRKRNAFGWVIPPLTTALRSRIN